MYQPSFIIIAVVATIANAASVFRRASTLADVCTVLNVQAALPLYGSLYAADGTVLAISPVSSSVTASAVYNSSAGMGMGMGMGMGGGMAGGSAANYPYCNVTVTYTHPGKDDTVVVKYAFPQPSDFKNRFYTAGGGGYSLVSTATGGLAYGAAGGATNAGYDAFDIGYDDAVLLANGSINWDATYAFGYQALGEMTVLGKAITKGFYSLSNSTKIYTYFEGCSDGGRQGMSQVQRWGGEYDGAITGAPAFRYAQQQVNHIFSSVVEHTLDYYPPPCALSKIVNATIAACDPLDGRTDGVVARTDLCMLQFNLSSIIGEPYSCAGTSQSSGSSSGGPGGAGGPGGMSAYQPAQNGTVTAQDVAVAQSIYDGLHNSAGQRAYLSWQIASEFGDAGTTWSNQTKSWELSITSIGGEFIEKFVKLANASNLSTLEGVTYDTVVDWMDIAYDRYLDSLQTTVPDLTPFQSSGGKLLHYHGESDPSVPSASSVHYWQSVRSIMYGNMTSNNSLDALADWYQLYLVPGAAHCSTNTLQPGPYPEDNMNTMINWVENAVTPKRLNATVASGSHAGETQLLCQFPYRPLWSGNSSTFDCVYDQASIDSWTYTFPAFKVPIY